MQCLKQATKTLFTVSQRKRLPILVPANSFFVTQPAPFFYTSRTNMATSLNTDSPPSKPSTPRPKNHPIATAAATVPGTDNQPIVNNITIRVKDSHGGSAHGFLHIPPPSTDSDPHDSRVGVILLSGAGGGVSGPSGMYLSLATKLPCLPQAPMKVLRLDYRFPARTKTCVEDVKAAMEYMSILGVDQFILVGWSFGGAPVFTVAGRDERVIGAATVASQTADALQGAREAGRRNVPVMLLHGTGDKTLSERCSRYVHEAWLEGYKGPDIEDKSKLVPFEGDDHALSHNAKKAEEMIAEFIVECAGGTISKETTEVVKSEVLGNREDRLKFMDEGGDLRGREDVA